MLVACAVSHEAMLDRVASTSCLSCRNPPVIAGVGDSFSDDLRSGTAPHEALFVW